MATLIADTAYIFISIQFFDFVSVFFLKLDTKLSKYTKINNHTMILINEQKPSSKLIYSLALIKLKNIKTNIKTNLIHSFIKPSKFLANTFIFFDKKLVKSFKFCVNHQKINNFTIKK